MNLLHTLGLMTRKEHERKVLALESHIAFADNAVERLEGERDRLDDKFKLAVTDLEKQAEEIAGYKHRAGLADDLLNAQSSEILALRPDALAMRRKRQMDRERVAGKRGVA